MIERKAVREAASSRFLSKHTATTGWKHRNLSHVEMALWSAAWSWEWWQPKHAGGVDDPSEIQRLQARSQDADNLQFSAGARETHWC